MTFADNDIIIRVVITLKKNTMRLLNIDLRHVRIHGGAIALLMCVRLRGDSSCALPGPKSGRERLCDRRSLRESHRFERDGIRARVSASTVARAAEFRRKTSV